MTQKHVNAIVVGAGAGGGVVAKELAEAGLTVVLFERGGWVGFAQHDDDEFKNQRSIALEEYGFGPDRRSPRVVETAPGQWRTVHPGEVPSFVYRNNAACVGSGTVVYGAMGWRFMEQDFRMRSVYGALEGSTLDDWPCSYADLEPFYEKAEYEIGVSGDMSDNPFAPPRAKPYPMPAFAYNTEGRLLAAGAKRLGWHSFPIPMLRNSVPYRNGNACIGRRNCVGHACPINAKNGTQNTVIPTALATGQCELRTHCIVAEIVVDDRGRARGLRYFDADDREHFQPADLVVVSGGAIETARLLLNSKSKLFPNGAGNRHDLVGRNLQDHAYTSSWGLFDDEVYDDVGSGATVAVCDFNHGQPGLRGGGLISNDFIRLPTGFVGVRPPGSPGWGKAHKDFQRRNFKRSIVLKACIQEMPTFDHRVQVDPVVKDHWGIPVVRLGYAKRHPHTLEIARSVAAKAEQWLKESGAGQTWQNAIGERAGASVHQAGTCRMGNDPKTSVTNRYGQVHDIDNLFLADGSLHVTNGGFNPALTIMALGYWVGDYIKRQWKGGGYR
jgi:choline dehydrogenase-like flavoprotein